MKDRIEAPSEPRHRRPTDTAPGLRLLGLEPHVATVEEGRAFARRTIGKIERRAAHGFLILSARARPDGAARC